jgi:hypothetical protein
MRQVLEIPEYIPEQGLRLVWEEGSSILLRCTDREVMITANRDGLVSLARHLLTLAQDNVPAGVHAHLGSWGGLDPGSVELVVDRAEHTVEEEGGT